MANTVDFLLIDGVRVDINVLADFDESADILDKYANRTQDGVLHRKVIGTYYNFSNIKFEDQNDKNYDAYEYIWQILSQPKAFHTITIGGYTFSAYVSSIKRKCNYFNNNRLYHKNMQCNFTAEKPART